ncbi:hypothetical protein H6P81_013933 [Aristolochia fimbriata]|uniref:Uncharacterized protein n=1 Tax=Aristolochia fimbriata TaxID=158543 RepID=A0AAV7EI88_ARIFI|nr:hypothetical protein H6P81_013933 [Aristolochia fimbriata]
MAPQGDEVASGWPFGLENMNLRLRNSETLQAVPAGSNSLRLHSTSFSSFSSSDLDTESTRSFFQDRSITLGRLIGIKPREGDLYFPTSFHFAEKAKLSVINAGPISPKTPEATLCHSACIPVIRDVLEKMSPGRHNTRSRSSEVD